MNVPRLGSWTRAGPHERLVIKGEDGGGACVTVARGLPAVSVEVFKLLISLLNSAVGCGVGAGGSAATHFLAVVVSARSEQFLLCPDRI